MNDTTNIQTTEDATKRRGGAPLSSSDLLGAIRHLVYFSGGICSWYEALLCSLKYGKEGLVLLFADTKMEDCDLYRFLDEAAENIGAPLVKIADGRTPWEVMRDEKLLANTRMDACSKILKRELLDRWTKQNCAPETTVLHFGMDWTEHDRLQRIKSRKAPWKVEGLAATWSPLLSKPQMIKHLKRQGIKPPRLYEMGFPHNNCGGFCVKAGQAHFALLLRTMPERYRYHEEQENKLRAELGWRQTILRDARGGKVKPITLTQFRERLEKMPSLFDEHEWGGCGCALPEAPNSSSTEDSP